MPRQERRLHILLTFLAALVALGATFAAPSVHAQGLGDARTAAPIPPELRSWTEWVLDGVQRCPALYDHADQTRCAWPARLELALGDKGGTFTQTWHVDATTAVPLPGNAKRWPLDVTVDGKPGVVVTMSALPHISLVAGEHTVRGAFAWDSLPESLAVPKETGLLSLTLRGAAVAAPNRDAQGTVWFQKSATTADEGDSLGVVVHRKVTDDIPLQLMTRIELHVSGKSREELLGKALPPDFVPMSLVTPLPARVEPDGRVRVQVRPGVFTLELLARAKGPVTKLTRPAPDGPWKEGDEVWVFEAKNDYRVVSVEGVTSIDPQQTTLPDAWKRLPAYPMPIGATMCFVESRRGDADPPPDQLTLARTLWLDFDGGGYTVQDVLTGSLNRESRLTMAPPTQLGRVAINGKDQFITTVLSKVNAGSETRDTGVEVRQGQLSVTADSRVVGQDVGDLPAVGWAHDFHQVSGTLHLPPGWTLLFATGVDDVPGTWVRHWSLLEIFLALMIGIVVGRLYGVGWGGLTLVMLVLTLPETDAPQWAWIPLLALEALVRVLPQTGGAARVRKLVDALRIGAFVLVGILTIPFVVQQVRQGLHPTLLQPGTVLGAGESVSDGFIDQTKNIPAPAEVAPEPSASGYATTLPGQVPSTETRLKKEDALEPMRGGSGGRARADDGKPAKAAEMWQSNSQTYDASTVVQTGPGLPRWQWRTLELKWSGPVAAGQRLHLYLVSPAVNLVLALLRSALLLLVVFRLLPHGGRILPRVWGAGPAAALALVVLAGFSPRPAYADIPDKATLEDLKARLLRVPPCSPTCASSGRMAIDLHASRLRLRVEVDVAATTAVALPGSGAQWTPSDVLVDGHPAQSLARIDDVLWVALDAGVHQVVLEGPLPDRASVQLSLPMKPHHVEVSAAGWTVAGVHEDGLADDDLQFTRTERAKGAGGAGGEAAEASLQPGTLPPFVIVTRTLHVGLDWEMETVLARVTPAGSAVVLEVPLLAGEKVTTADVRVVGGKAQVFLGPEATAFTWHSVLTQKSPIRLVAPKDVAWTEVWRMDIGPIWHATYSGIPFVHAEPVGGTKIPEWRPWPGEEGVVNLSRPDGIPGQTLTIDESTTALHPGLRATDVVVTLGVRSSRGGDHSIVLPEEAQLESLSINGKTQPIRQEGRKVTIPIVPGAQTLVLTFRVATSIGTLFVSPAIDLGAPSVNATVTVNMPGGRWLLFTAGPRVGPAVLFWSLLLVLLVLAFVVGHNRWTPLRTWHWALLFVGLSQLDVVAGAVFVGWLLVLGYRARESAGGPPHQWYNLRQLVIVAWTFAALVILAFALQQGLLGTPEMQVMGNGSSHGSLRWFTDRADNVLPGVRVVSVPLLVYRGAMLAWALWIVLSLISWLKWGWGAFTNGGGWKKAPPRAPTPPQGTAPPTAVGPVEPTSPPTPGAEATGPEPQK